MVSAAGGLADVADPIWRVGPHALRGLAIGEPGNVRWPSVASPHRRRWSPRTHSSPALTYGSSGGSVASSGRSDRLWADRPPDRRAGPRDPRRRPRAGQQLVEHCLLGDRHRAYRVQDRYHERLLIFGQLDIEHWDQALIAARASSTRAWPSTTWPVVRLTRTWATQPTVSREPRRASRWPAGWRRQFLGWRGAGSGLRCRTDDPGAPGCRGGHRVGPLGQNGETWMYAHAAGVTANATRE